MKNIHATMKLSHIYKLSGQPSYVYIKTHTHTHTHKLVEEKATEAYRLNRSRKDCSQVSDIDPAIRQISL